jgi:Replication-relaxation
MRRYPVRPDALFVIRDASRPEGQNTLTYVLEADRHTEHHEPLRKKMRAYVQYVQEDKNKWGCKYFRVIIVTEKPTERARQSACHPVRTHPSASPH